MYIVSTITGLLMCCQFMTEAATDTLPVKFQYSLSQNSILQGEPLSMRVTVETENSTHKYCVGYDMNPYTAAGMAVRMYDSSMKPFGAQRSLPVWPSSQWLGPTFCADDLERKYFEIPVHMFFSTDVPEGMYYLKLTALNVTIFCGSDKHIHAQLTSPMLPLAVQKGETEKVLARYANLIKNGLTENREKPCRGWTANDWVDYPNDIRMIMWAYGSMAVGSQIDGLYDQEHHLFRFWNSFTIHAYQNILEYASLSEIKRLALIAESPEFLSGETSDGFDSNLVWLFQELKKRGDPTIISVVEATLSRFPKTVNIGQLENPPG